MEIAANGKGVEGPSYSALLKVALPSDPSNPATATVYAFEIGRFPKLVEELEAFIQWRGVRGRNPPKRSGLRPEPILRLF